MSVIQKVDIENGGDHRRQIVQTPDKLESRCNTYFLIFFVDRTDATTARDDL